MRKGTAVGTALVLLLALTACGDDDSSSSSDAGGGRPVVEIGLRDGGIALPATIQGGLTDLVLKAAEGEQDHHLVFLRLNDGVTFEQAEQAGDEALLGLVTFQGGNGSAAPGTSTLLTLDLQPGNYVVADLPQGQMAASGHMVVTAPAAEASPPEDRGTIDLGPGFDYDVPAGAKSGGRFEFANADASQPHEAVLLALQPGKRAQDVVQWAKTFDGPPPADFVGGFGALGPGKHGWIDLGKLDGGTRYALACFLTGPDGTPHAASGMVTELH